jgi:hypothetical protein
LSVERAFREGVLPGWRGPHPCIHLRGRHGP